MPIGVGYPIAAAAAPSMMGPILGAAGIGAASALGGGLLSSSSNKKAARRAERFNREVLQNAVQWRVADAKRAGVHPLFALGAQVGTSGGNPQFIGEPLGPAIAEAGQDISNALVRQQTGNQRLKDQMDLALAGAQLRETDARTGYIQAQQRALEQANQQSPAGMGLQSEKLAVEGQAVNPPGVGVIDLQASQQTSAKVDDPGSVAGEHPWMQLNRYGPLPFYTPRGMGEHPEELLSEMSFPAYMGLVMFNANKFGKDWLEKFIKLRYFGDPAFSFKESVFGLKGESGTDSAMKRALRRGWNIPQYPRYKRLKGGER